MTARIGMHAEMSRAGHERHMRKCATATPEQRAYYRQHGFWPMKPGARDKLTVLRPTLVAPRPSRPRLPRGPKP